MSAFNRLLCCFFLLHLAWVTRATCYYSSGKLAVFSNDGTYDIPCDPAAPVSACCGAGEICISNMECMYADRSSSWFGSCTDQTWMSPACPCPGGGNLTLAVL